MSEVMCEVCDVPLRNGNCPICDWGWSRQDALTGQLIRRDDSRVSVAYDVNGQAKTCEKCGHTKSDVREYRGHQPVSEFLCDACVGIERAVGIVHTPITLH